MDGIDLYAGRPVTYMPDAASSQHKPRRTYESYTFQSTETMYYGGGRHPSDKKANMENGKKVNTRKIYTGVGQEEPPSTHKPAQRESTSKTETVSAFGELNLVQNEMKQYRTTELRQPYRPPSIRDNYEARRGNPNESLDSVVRFSRTEPLLENGRSGRSGPVYKPTVARSEASVASTKKSYGKISEVYSHSGDTVEFAHNLGAYLTSIVSPFVWISLFVILALWGMVLVLVGAFNLPLCRLQPMIPVYLIVTGSLFILLAAIRIYSLWPMPNNARPSNLGLTIACRGIEGLVIIGIFVWLILGCIWVYGKRSVYHHETDMFEMHNCDPGTYWIAFTSVTLHLALLGIGIIIGMIIIACGLWKETDQTNMARQP